MGFRLNRLELQETDTSVLVYSREDWINDSRLLEPPWSIAEPACSTG